MKKLILTIFLAGATLGLFAQDIISVAELSGKLNDKNLVLISARKDSEYKQVHIRNAISLPVTELSETTPIDGILKSPQELAKILGDKGVCMDKEIVIYCNKGNSAGRMYWILKYMGYENVKLLDGNINAWKEDRKPVTRAPKMLPKCSVTPNLKTQYLVDKSYVIQTKDKPGTVLVDARTPALFDGTDPTSKGHIPGAVNISTELLQNENGLMKSADELTALYASKGVTKDKEVILYCQTSTRAGFEFMVLTSILGFQNVKVYDGAYNEWSADPSMSLIN